MTMLALEEERKFNKKNNEKQKRRKHMSNKHGQKMAGKIAVITGGSSGIGLATAKRFVEEGGHVVITGRREKELKEASLHPEKRYDGRGRRVALGRSGPALCRRERETWSHRRTLRERGRGYNRTARGGY